MENEFTTIKVSKTLTSHLKLIGNKSETYEDIIWKLVKKCEKCDKK